MAATLTLLPPIPPQPRPYTYECLARVLLDAEIGITPAIVRLNAAAQPDLAYLYNGVAEAMDALAAPS